jgi:hypothetical protein
LLCFWVVKILAILAAASLVLLGCASSPVPPLLTGVPLAAQSGDTQIGCVLDATTGALVADSAYGTQIVLDGGSRVPVMWPPGFTARFDGAEVAVRDTDGHPIATTGERYRLTGGFLGRDADALRYSFPVFWACGPVSKP